MFPDSPGVYSNYNFGQLFQQLAALGTGIANSVSGNTQGSYPPTLYPWAAYNGYGPNPYNPIYNAQYGPYGNLPAYPNPNRSLFDTYNSGPLSGSSGILVLGGIILIVVLLARR